jgi:hypothetical protein
MMRDADDAMVQQAHRLCERVARAVEEATNPLQFAKRRLAYWQLESDRITTMKSEFQTLSARLPALQDEAGVESVQWTAFRVDMVTLARSCGVVRRARAASREQRAARAASSKRTQQGRT